MLKRALSSIVAVALFLGLCFGGLLPFAVGATVVATLAVWEWITAYRNAEGTGKDAERLPAWQNTLNIVFAVMGIAFPLLVYVAAKRNGWQHPLSVSAIDTLKLAAPVLVFALLTVRAARSGKALGDIRRWYGVVGMVYIGLLLSSLVWLRALNYHYIRVPANVFGLVSSYTQIRVAPFGFADRGAWLMLLVAVCVWATDTGAYLVGRSLGKHKLAPVVSPGKTIEGSLGGLALALLTGALFGHWIHLPLQHGLAIGLIAGVMGQWGDLFESALKREIGLKDFGNLMPGHGGALDRIDSLLFVTPLAFCYLHLVVGY